MTLYCRKLSHATVLWESEHYSFVYRVPLLSPMPVVKIKAVSRWCQVFCKSAKLSPVQRLRHQQMTKYKVLFFYLPSR